MLAVIGFRPLDYFILTILSFALSTFAQFPPPVQDENLTTVQSPVDGNITINFKSPPVGTCTTIFGTQKQYTGYVNLSSSTLNPSLGNYNVNTFFWFIEARQVPETAPLTIFINGGPGSSSMVGLFQEVGPCEVVEIARGKLGTVARTWGWDRSSNMLFIDQPVQVGFSYDVATNASLNLLDETLVIPPTSKPIAQPSYTFFNGTFSSDNPMFTANTSQLAAQAIWHFLQAFLTRFPEYNSGVRYDDPMSNGVASINLFTESYGGKYGPAIGSFFQTQNALRESNPAFANDTVEINLNALGIMNGWVDLLVQTPFHPRFAFNNSYGIQAIDQVQELNALSAFDGANGCMALTSTCRAEETGSDPEGTGEIDSVNNACSQAQLYCQNNVVGPYTTSGRSVYDISQNSLDPFPDSHYLEYLNTLSVQQAIGVPVNYTQDSQAVFFAFDETGDYARNGIIRDLVNLLNSGVRVALIYGDRDYICNWVGGEAISYAIAGGAGSGYLPWYSAGYAPIVTNNSYIGGEVREFGNLSFSRIYDAGHLVPAYQPETAFTIFSRVIQGTDISLGGPVDLGSYASFGDANSTYSNSAPSAAEPTCFLRAVNNTCNTDQKNMLANNAGVVINGVLYADESDWQTPNPSVITMAGVPGTAAPSMIPNASATLPKSVMTKSHHAADPTSLPTGVYTATGIPNVTSTTSSAKNEATRQLELSLFRDTQPAAAMILLGFFSFGFL